MFAKVAPVTGGFALAAGALLAVLLFAAPSAFGATKDTASATASPGPYLVGQPITFTSTTPCTVNCRLIWRYLDGTRLGQQLGEGVSVQQAFDTAGLKTVQLDLNELCVGTSQLTCSSFAYVSVFVEDAVPLIDTTPPTFTVSGLTAEATGPTTVVDYVFNATDQDDAVVSQSCTPPPGSSFAVGSTTINCTATDATGNVGNESFAVEVSDTTAPDVTVPAATAAEATSADGAVVTFDASASDLVDGALAPTCSQASGTTFPLGSTTVTCTATDTHGNEGSASFAVDVSDTTAPVVTVPASITARATSAGGAVVTFTVSASDLVDGDLAPTCSPASGSTFPVGSTTVTCTATDAHGNVGSASFNVVIRRHRRPHLRWVR